MSDSTSTLNLRSMSYSDQYDYFVAQPKDSVDFKKACAKPCKKAQAGDTLSRRLPFSNVHALAKHPSRYYHHWGTTVFMISIHTMCFMAPATFTPCLAAATLGAVVVFGLGIEMVYHRLLCHKSFRTPKFFEYLMAYFGVLNIQGDPIEWVSDHRYHHQHTDTPMDPHSPYEGLWWAHMGWLWDNEVLWPRKGSFANAQDLKDQAFYRFIAKTYWWHIAAQFLILYAVGGLPSLVWLGCVRIVVIFHITFSVNSAGHVWGSQPYETNDLSKNCMWIAMLSMGEWHNNHHAFETSANTGLEWWQFDATYAIICLMSYVGLASHIKVPSRLCITRRLRQVS